MYLGLLKGALTHTLYFPLDLGSSDQYVGAEELIEAVKAAVARGEIDLNDPAQMWQTREEGKDWPEFAQTMVGLRRLENVQACIEQLLDDDVPGDLIETGVWRGGTAIFMRGLLKAYGQVDRKVVAADSYCGLPEPDPVAYPDDEGSLLHTAGALAVSLEQVKDNFRRYDLLDDQVEFVEGWFKDTLPLLTGRTWALMRLDGDMYESTMDALRALYPSLAPGGFVIIDDYFAPPCRQAVEDYRSQHGIHEPIEMIDWSGAFWRREH